MKIRHKLVPSSYLIILENNKILLSRRFNTGFQDGKYGLVAGHGEENESFKMTLVREAKEEINIDIDAEDLEVVHVLSRNEKLNPQEIRERIDIFFKPAKWRGEIKNMEPEKCDAIAWFPLSDLPENIIPYIKFVIENIKKNINYSEFGF
ncbi:MAG TPA: NUDIX hydrolase [Candidatus Moranbacteria bacterium]|nr:NUDIX hydrolase [Candidatus Moranbacteria bacterium]